MYFYLLHSRFLPWSLVPVYLAKFDSRAKYFFCTGALLTVFLWLLLMSLRGNVCFLIFFFLLYCFVGLFSLSERLTS